MLAASVSRSSRSPRNSRCSSTAMVETADRPAVSDSQARRQLRRQSVAQAVTVRDQRAAAPGSPAETTRRPADTGRVRSSPARTMSGSLAQRVCGADGSAGAGEHPGSRGGRRGSAAPVEGHPGAAVPRLQRRRDAEAGVAAEQLVAAGADQRHAEARVANGLGDAVRVQAVEGRLIERLDGRVERRREARPRSAESRDARCRWRARSPARSSPSLNSCLVEAEREGVDRRRVGTLSQRRDRAGIDAAGQEDARPERRRSGAARRCPRRPA